MSVDANGILCIVSDKAISEAEVFRWASDRAHGGRNFFFGAVRGRNHGREVVAVSYDAFVPLAEKVLREICEEARSRWGDTIRLFVHHRTGKLEVGEMSIAIGASSPHRDEAYQASRYVIEEIKKRVPIWKKEFYADGETEWLRGHALCSHGKGASHETARDGAGGGTIHPHGH